MEINQKVMRKIITNNYTYIMSSSSSRSFENSPSSSHRILAEGIKELASLPHEVKDKFVDVITPVTPDGEVFRDFDVSMFFSHFGLDSLQKCVLAVGLKSSPRADLRNKGHDIVSKSFRSMLEILANPSKHPEMTPEAVALFVEQMLSEPAYQFFDNVEKLNLSYASRSRYKNTALPQEVFNITEPIEKLRQQESLVQIFQQIGPESTASLEKCREVLKRKWRVQISESEVTDVLVLMATSRNAIAWHADIFVQALQQENLAQSFDWERVIEGLDREDFILEGPEGLHVILSALQHGTSSVEFPIYKLWGGRWQHPRAQWSVLRGYIKADTLDVMRIPGIRKVFSSADFATASSALKLMVATFETHKFISFDAVDVLFYLALNETIPRDIQQAAQAEMEKAAKFTPELLLCGALMIPKPWPQTLDRIVSKLLDIFFEGHTSHQLVFWRLWQVDKPFVTNRFLEYHAANNLNITRILDISQDLRCLSDLLEAQNAIFVLDVASLAARREYLNLEKWLQEMINKYEGEFVMQCYRFLHIKADAEYTQAREGGKPTMVSLRVGPVHTFLTLLDKNQPPMTQEHQERVTECQRLCIQAYPRLINLGSGLDAIILQNNAESNGFPPHVDKDMQQNYKMMYSQETELNEVVQYLQKLKISVVPQEQDLFACMIHGLFDEYHCYPSYPLQALATTSVLFGSIILYKLIDGIPLRVALAMVWQAVRDHEPSSTMYKFGLQALLHFKDRLKEWKEYCKLLAQVPGLQGTDIWSIVQDVIAGTADRQVDPQPVNGSSDSDDLAPPLTNGNSSVQPPSPVQPSHPHFQSVNADPPLRDQSLYKDPDIEVQDKVLFIVNNLSHTNLDSKLKDLKDALQEEHHQWFADYLVVKRAKMEPNYHPLYLDLLDKFGHKGLMAEVLRETYINIIGMLNAEATMQNASERTYLKQLASWLGGLTIAKDKPIKFKNVSFKDLIIEGYITERLSVVLPFTRKVLEQSTKSTVFKPPNPWLMAIIRLLAELYQHVELKLNSRFEIEVLCKNLGLDIKTIEPATDIRETRDRPVVKEEEALPPIEDLSLQPPQGFAPITDPVPSGYADEVIINSLIQHPALKRILQTAIDRAIREIIGPVVERSVTIASISTSELIQKDYATEGDESKMRGAAHNLVRHLAGSLAHVTCKDPLRMSMTNNIRSLLAQNGYNEASVSDQTVTMCVNDNIDLACNIIEKTAQDRAIPEIDDSLAQAYQTRKQHRERRLQHPFMAANIPRIAFHLPDQFRLKPGGITPQQMSVYDDFGRGSRIATHEAAARNSFTDPFPSEYMSGGAQSTGIVDIQRAQEQSASVHQQLQIDPKELNIKIGSLLSEMRRAARSSDEEHLEDISTEHLIFHFCNAILQSISANHPLLTRPVKDGLCSAVASQICQILFTDGQDQTQLEVEALVYLLRKVCELSASTRQDVVLWLAQPREDERLFNAPVTVMLLKTDLISVTHLDTTIAKSLNTRRPRTLEFLSRVMKETVLGPNPLVLRSDFAASLDALGHWLKQEPTNKVALDLVREIQGPEEKDEQDQLDLEDREKRDQMEYIFTEWMQLCQHLSTTEKNYSAFIMQLHQGKVLADMASSCEFFRTCIEFCIGEYEQTTVNGGSIQTNCYIPIDALAKLVILLVKYQVEDDSKGQFLDKADYLNSILALVVFVFNFHHETRGEHFSQKVFFRFFSSMLYEYHCIESQLGAYQERILMVFSECFLTIQPAFFPMFSFHWMTLVCHRYFMPKLLTLEGDKGCSTFAKILETMLIYIGTLLKELPIPPVIKLLYRGVLRILLVLHHDFPEFLAEWHFSICEVIPVHCTQLRNLILSAYPSTLSDLPDPFTAGLKVDRLPEIRIAPKICGDVLKPLVKSGVKELVDSCLASTDGPSNTAIRGILDRLETEPRKEAGLGFNTVTINSSILNSLVLYVGMEAIKDMNAKGLSFQTASPHAALFARLAADLSPQARYFFLSAIANHLRYPNSHTHYFSYLLLFLFGPVQNKSTESDVRQQITRVLLERLIVHRPHPWGLIITLLELLKNPTYDFWNLPFIKSAPEIERLFGALFQHINNSSSPPRQ
ncbi:Not1-domain-containing protein [Morchella conica CCBAS932]|uniref:General negative regulator of transcription subunit 1 n=1 Tax=Morchella conica CCBAS932 TaxID=1392247 RepID=A0A3N4KLZ6_9PEZI|nr:Not1-domain-containing protein [Morchella conica CCBAS932]